MSGNRAIIASVLFALGAFGWSTADAAIAGAREIAFFPPMTGG